MTTAGPRVVLILGMERRSGTNFLSDLITLHPDARRVSGLPEDFLLRQAHHLDAYVSALRKSWPERWQIDPGAEDALLRRLGDGLLAWLTATGDPTAHVVVSKTPSVRNLELARRLWPEVTLLVLTRDGRHLVESGVRSFDWSYRTAFMRWAAAARSVLAFDVVHRSDSDYRLVRYEDLVRLDVKGLRELLVTCGLDPDRLSDDEWSAALRAAPVRGSSESRGSAGTVSWRPTSQPAAFSPLSRADEWTPAVHALFRRLAGSEQTALGYPLGDDSGDGPRGRVKLVWSGRQRWIRRRRRRLRVLIRGRS